MPRFLEIVAPFTRIIPEVKRPTRPVKREDRRMWTLTVLFIFLVCCQIPLAGIQSTNSADPFYWMRVILASNKGSLMELGISPIVTSGLVMQLLSETKIIDYNKNDENEKKLFDGAQKLCGIVITFGEAVAYVLSGMYGDVADLGFGNVILIILQLLVAGFVVILLDDLLDKDYGYGSGISIFIATNVCENVIWRAFSPTTVSAGKGTEFEGAVIALFHLLTTRSDKVRALQEAFARPNLPNMGNLLATVVVFLVVIAAQGMRAQVNCQQKNTRARFPYPIKLFYTSNMPIILQTAVVSNLYFFSQLLFRRFPTNILVQLLGKWQVGGSGQSIPVGGLAYFVSPPRTWLELILEPVHSLFYIAFVLTSCALFSKVWIEVSGISSRHVRQSFEDRQLMIPGVRGGDKTEEVLNRYIPIAAMCGGMCIGILTIFADLLGAMGSGTGILLAVTTIYDYYEKDATAGKGMMGI